MKLLIVLCLVAMAYAQQQQEAQILRQDYDNNGDGNYRWAFEQSDGFKHEQQGDIRNQGSDDEYLAVKGQYSYVGADGVTYVVTYVADENGYQPTIEQGPGGGVPPGVVASLLG